jgi:hypothetical protein
MRQRSALCQRKTLNDRLHKAFQLEALTGFLHNRAEATEHSFHGRAMARGKQRSRFRGRILEAIEKRDLINADEADAEVLRSYGRLYLEADRYSEALDFFLRAEDAEGLHAIRDHALEVADNFLLHRLARSQAIEVTKEDWQALARQAEKLGKTSVAEAARARFETPPPPTNEPAAADSGRPASKRKR